MPNNNPGYNPLDPFAEKEEIFETKEIRSSKAREAKRRADYLKKKEKTENKVKKPSLLSRIKTFFKELPEREDKKKVYAKIYISLFLTALTIAIFIFIISPKIQEQKILAEKNLTYEVGDFVENINESDPEEFKEKRQDYIDSIENKLKNIDQDSQEKYDYYASLLLLYGTETNYEKRIELSELILENPELEVSTKAVLLMNLKTLYKEAGLMDKVNDVNKRLLELPDSDTIEVDGGTSINDMKDKIRAEVDDGNR